MQIQTVYVLGWVVVSFQPRILKSWAQYVWSIIEKFFVRPNVMYFMERMQSCKRFVVETFYQIKPSASVQIYH